MYVKYIGTTQQRYFADYQRLLDSEGRLFSPKATIPENDQVDLNPGVRARVQLDFEMPEGTQPSDYVLDTSK